MSAASPRIAIVGAGPVGLCFARILQQKNIEFVVFEGEASPHIRGQGGSLDLHPPTGQAALKAAGLFDEFQKHARYDGQALKLADRHGKIYVDLDGSIDTGRPEIDRSALRQILLDSVKPESIKWGHHVARADPDAGAIYFRDGSIASGFDLIVGADGVWSHIRPLVHDFVPHYSGIGIYETFIHDIDVKQPHLSKFIGRGSMFAFGEQLRQNIVAQRQGDGSMHSYVFFGMPQQQAGSRSYHVDDANAARATILDRMRPHWAPEMLEVLEKCDDDITFRPLYQMPVGLRWPTRKGVTLIGDAAHAMSPFTGEGVNFGMTDAWKLAEAIAEHPADLVAAVRQYETYLMPEIKEKTTASWDSLVRNFEPGWINAFAKPFLNMSKDGGFIRTGLQAERA